ncbi:PREDICTED: probable WRKY transcription factor 71 [Fragaria vesca subsp. vesca]|uniref:probable WRKY transcription factor 71 n=1 Tax=Fragaria vesca subsp. vesca TaxID=101020 RepID=UPI0002C2FD87|nr:PREDICTED: probable WRKY transcription factor 71 [Fragaria vesca subsp. vesca]
MSDHHHEPKDLYYHDLFQYDDHGQLNGGMIMNSPKVSGSSSPAYNNINPLQGFDVPSYLNTSFTEYSSLATAFGLSSSTSDHEVFSSIDEGNHQKPADNNLGYLRGGGGGHVSSDGEVLMTPNSSVSSSSGEAGAEEGDSGNKNKKDRQKPKGSSEEGGDVHSPKKSSKIVKKKGEKKQREPRFAFMTKSEVDHLEDGYRWRKYGQKAVKNSPYPRSYYRCTTQKCGVKKRVERSFEDPSTVITTYEGQHNHPIPATLRGSININAAHHHHAFFSPQSMYASAATTTSSSGPSFPQEYLFQMAQQPQMMMRNDGGGGGVYTSRNVNVPQQYHQLSGDQYGLLQDVVPSMFFKQEP